MEREEAIKVLDEMFNTYDELHENTDGDLGHEQMQALQMAIEALSAKPTDLISRVDAIEAIESRQTEQWIDADVDYNNGLESAVAEIKALPSADRPSGEWQPVGEGLPQRVGSYIVTCQDEHGSVYVDYDFWTVLDEFKYNRDKVTAWMPFPRPYCCSYGERKDNIT